jgi:hypothetical protein
MATYRERREARAERLRDWADKREVKSQAALEQANAMHDAIPFGQPILVGHYSEGRDRRYRDRAWNTMGRGVEHGRKAEEMRRKADNIEAAADRAIYSDDPDAVDRLAERIAGLEAERDMLKRYNASCRKAAKTGGTGDLSILDDKWRAEIATLTRVCPYQMRAGGGFPAYVSSNLSGNIARLRKRLADLGGA